MPKIKTNPMIVLDNTFDNTVLELFVSSNLPTSQIKEGTTVNPSWETTPLVLSPSVYVNNTLLSNPVISWQRRSGGGSFTSTLIDGESVNNNALTVNKNILASDENKIITYKCTVTYGDITRSEEISYSLNIVGQDGAGTAADFVVQQGPSGSWIIRKWDSGIAECWRKISGTITNSGTWNNFKIFSGSADFPSNFFISSPNVQYCCYIGSGYAINARGVLSTTTKFNWAALGTDGDSNISYIVDCYAIGKWK